MISYSSTNPIPWFSPLIQLSQLKNIQIARSSGGVTVQFMWGNAKVNEWQAKESLSTQMGNTIKECSRTTIFMVKASTSAMTKFTMATGKTDSNTVTENSKVLRDQASWANMKMDTNKGLVIFSGAMALFTKACSRWIWCMAQEKWHTRMDQCWKVSGPKMNFPDWGAIQT